MNVACLVALAVNLKVNAYNSCTQSHRYENSHAIWDHTVLPVIRNIPAVTSAIIAVKILKGDLRSANPLSNTEAKSKGRSTQRLRTSPKFN